MSKFQTAMKVTSVLAACAFVSLLAMKFLDSNINIDSTGKWMDPTQRALPLDARAKEYLEISDTPGWQNDPVLSARYDELSEGK